MLMKENIMPEAEPHFDHELTLAVIKRLCLSDGIAGDRIGEHRIDLATRYSVHRTSAGLNPNTFGSEE